MGEKDQKMRRKDSGIFLLLVVEIFVIWMPNSLQMLKTNHLQSAFPQLQYSSDKLYIILFSNSSAYGDKRAEGLYQKKWDLLNANNGNIKAIFGVGKSHYSFMRLCNHFAKNK